MERNWKLTSSERNHAIVFDLYFFVYGLYFYKYCFLFVIQLHWQMFFWIFHIYTIETVQLWGYLWPCFSCHGLESISAHHPNWMPLNSLFNIQLYNWKITWKEWVQRCLNQKFFESLILFYGCLIINTLTFIMAGNRTKILARVEILAVQRNK